MEWEAALCQAHATALVMFCPDIWPRTYVSLQYVVA